jgi:heme o synthase
MILITTLAGFYMGTGVEFEFALALKVLAGTALAAGGTLALNEFMEREFDALMARTQNRPLPSGRLKPAAALTFGSITAVLGIGYLWLAVNPLSAIVTGAVSVLYLGAYTPMKRYTWFCHIIGGVPGALPPVVGWAAARGTLSAEPFVLFGIMLLWQLPHSLSIARIYQADYARAGLSLLPKTRSWGNPANAVMITASIVLLLIGMLPTLMGFAGKLYLPFAIAFGLYMAWQTVRLVWRDTSAAAARRVMMTSLYYLPAVLLMMVLDKV